MTRSPELCTGLVDSDEFNVVAVHGSPLRVAHCELQHGVPVLATLLGRRARLDVGQRAGHPQRCSVVVPGPGRGLIGLEAGEDQVQGSLTHLPSNSLALVAASHPRAGLRGAPRRKCVSFYRAHAHGGSVDDDGEIEVPVVDGRVGTVAPVEAQCVRSNSGDGTSVHGLENGIVAGSWMPSAASNAEFDAPSRR